jgi:fatty-acyl-CoA synthase
MGTVSRVSDVEKGEKYAYESIGNPMPFTEVKIIDRKTGHTLPINQDGEVCVRGFSIMKGYWDEPEKTAEVIDKNGWFKTGDVCSMDEKGYLYFKSRSKEIVIRGGTNIYPAEVERDLTVTLSAYPTKSSAKSCAVGLS